MLSRRQLLIGSFAGLAASQLGVLADVGDWCMVTARKTTIISRGNPNLAHYCLTYDDCWDDALTYAIGEKLAEQGIQATFFPAGRAIRANIDTPTFSYENLYPRLLEMGHEFGCHTYNHPNITDMSTRTLINVEIKPWQAVLEEALGQPYETVAFRPPMGIITDALFDASIQTGLPITLWTADMQDHLCADDCQDDLEARFDKTLQQGVLYLHHCTSGALAVINHQVTTASAQGYAHVPLSQLLRDWCDG